jgi:multiple sugar transport system ATP-binding protein
MGNVEVRNLYKKFEDVTAIRGLNLTVSEGEFLVLLGPSGCGKTTTLRCIAGLEVPDEGEIYIDNKLVNNVPPKDRNVAMVFQNYALYPHMNVYKNLAFPLKMRKYSNSEIDKRVKEVATLLKIEHLLNRRPRQLSGGEAQRVALGRALVRNPAVFLMDEPLSNLDAKLRLFMRAELKRMQKDVGTTTIYVTHDQAEAMTMGDRIAIMNEGILQQIATPEDAYNHPSNFFVAGFLGSPPMNFIDCAFKEKNGHYILDASEFQLEIAETIGEELKSTGIEEIILGIRPEDITLHNRPIKPNAIQGEVYIYEPLGSELIVDLKVGKNLIKIKSSPSHKIKIGDMSWMTFDQNRIHIFDKKTGKTLV